jgi:hypothetical protein
VPSGDLIVVGTTDSLDFPVTAGAVQTSFGGAGSDGFVARESLLPAGAGRYGNATPTCVGPPIVDVTSMPRAGVSGFAIAAAAAPPGAFGVLAIGALPDRIGTPVLGAVLHVSTAGPVLWVPVRADGLGAVEARSR